MQCACISSPVSGALLARSPCSSTSRRSICVAPVAVATRRSPQGMPRGLRARKDDHEAMKRVNGDGEGGDHLKRVEEVESSRPVDPLAVVKGFIDNIDKEDLWFYTQFTTVIVFLLWRWYVLVEYGY